MSTSEETQTWMNIMADIEDAKHNITQYKRHGKFAHCEKARSILKKLRKRLAIVSAELCITEEDFKTHMKGTK